jgi:large subunit ribosomal protein L22
MSTMERRRISDRRQNLLGDEPGAFAVARYVRVTPQKARRVAELVRGRAVDDALAVLRFSPQSASEVFAKTLESAVCTATTTEDLDRNTLVVTAVTVDEGPTLKRWRARARGSANRILKRTSHITVVVQPADDGGTR